MTINTKTELYGVMGDPIAHSLSPVMHNTALNHVGYNGVYLAFPVKDVTLAIAGMRALNIKGMSVTIPHKLSVMYHLDKIDDQAARIGAVNTIKNDAGWLTGYNTDCLGAVHALMEKTAIKDEKVVMIGAGGAARAIGFGLLAEGGNLTIFNQLEDEGKQLAKDLDVPYYHLSEYEKIDCKILINATPVGMTPNIEATPVPKEILNKDMVVMDIVYNPLKTRLLQAAEELGCKTVDGVAMFVYQGVAQFELWTGEKAPVQLMRDTVLDCLTPKD